MQIVVEDNGVGIKPENIEKLFVNYSRLEEHNEINAKGTGLGLSICNNIIQQMGGNVEVQSKLGEGTQFIITLQMQVLDAKLVIQENQVKTEFEIYQYMKQQGAF